MQQYHIYFTYNCLKSALKTKMKYCNMKPLPQNQPLITSYYSFYPDMPSQQQSRNHDLRKKESKSIVNMCPSFKNCTFAEYWNLIMTENFLQVNSFKWSFQRNLIYCMDYVLHIFQRNLTRVFKLPQPTGLFCRSDL